MVVALTRSHTFFQHSDDFSSSVPPTAHPDWQNVEFPTPYVLQPFPSAATMAVESAALSPSSMHEEKSEPV